jgi:hypothetical protein
MSDFSATATAEGKAITNTNFTVTANSTASSVSEVSYEDALNTATNLAINYANETAKYGANIINQAIDIFTYLINYNTKQINSAPDLTFYYSNSYKHFNSHIINLGSVGIQQNAETKLFLDAELTNILGFTTLTKTVYKTASINGFYPQVNLRSFYLPNGTLFFVIHERVFENEEGNFVVPNGDSTFQIISGTGEYLNKTGIIKIIFTNETKIRKVDVYFNNN